MRWDSIYSKVAEEVGLSKELVEKVYKSYWKAMKEHISSMPMKEDLSDVEFLRLQPNVNIPSIGKLYVTLDRYRGMKKNKEWIKKEKDASHKES